MRFNSRDTATILAALRFWQREGWSAETELCIASDGNAFAPLCDAEIDTLCDAINSDVTQPTAVIETNGGVINCIRSNAPMQILVLDEDIESAGEDQLRTIGDETYYVRHTVLAEPSESGRDGIDAAFVQGVLEQVCEAAEAKTLFTGFMTTPDGERIQVDFSVRKGATQPEKDLEFFAALCQEVQIDYLELGAYADQAK